MKIFNLAAFSLLIIAFNTNVNATTVTSYAFDITNPPGSAKGGKITSLPIEYDETNQQLSFSSTIERENTHLVDGFWLVLSDGPNPKGNVNEYAIFYGDSLSGNLTTYVYNGANSANSWQQPLVLRQYNVGGVRVP